MKVGDKFYLPQQHGYFTIVKIFENTSIDQYKAADIEWEIMEGYGDTNDYLSTFEFATLSYEGDPIYKFETEQELLQLKLKYG